MIRVEYTIDGKVWNHVTTDFNTTKDANDWIVNAGIKDYARTIKIFTIVKEEILRIDQK